MDGKFPDCVLDVIKVNLHIEPAIHTLAATYDDCILQEWAFVSHQVGELITVEVLCDVNIVCEMWLALCIDAFYEVSA